MEEMKRKYEEDARKQAEEFNDFKEKYRREFLALCLKHDNELFRLKEEHQKQTALETELHKFNEKSLKEKMEQLHEKQQKKLMS
uniref:Uncharacterized protein n=1 Tax=Anguilla anguilla TaxID=7936 RepID=A0A0E9Y0Q3_ANGAN